MAEEVVTFVTGNQKKLQEVISILGPQIGFSVSLTIVLESIFYNDKIKELIYLFLSSYFALDENQGYRFTRISR